MSKNSRRSTCQRVSDGTDGAHPWRYRKVPAEQIALATSRAVHIRLLGCSFTVGLDAAPGYGLRLRQARWTNVARSRGQPKL